MRQARGALFFPFIKTIGEDEAAAMKRRFTKAAFA